MGGSNGYTHVVMRRKKNQGPGVTYAQRRKLARPPTFVNVRYGLLFNAWLGEGWVTRDHM